MTGIVRTLIFISGVAVWGTAEAVEYRCQKKDSSLRIAVEVKKAGHTLPCEVIAEDDRGERAVLYRAQYDREYCPSRIEKTRTELEGEGWRCERSSDINIVSEAFGNGREADDGDTAPRQAANGKTITASRRCRLGNLERAIRVEVENPASGTPCELIYWSDGDQSVGGELLWRAVHDAEFCPSRLNVIIEKWSAEGWSCDGADGTETAALTQDVATTPRTPVTSDEPDAAGEEVEALPESDDGDTELEAVVEKDARRIGEWMEVDPDIEIAARGDLNDDGSEDAVVVLAYQSEQSAYRQYLMSYLGAEGGYKLAGVKLLTGVDAPPANAKVEQIDKGVIWLSMPGPSGETSEPLGYKLANEQLVEVDTRSPSSVAAD